MPAHASCEPAAGPSFALVVAELLAAGTPVAIEARGLSMGAAIPHGARLEVEPLAGGAVRPGEIVLLRGAHGGPLVHRVARVFRRAGEPWVQTWGDACALPDEPVPASLVLGRVRCARAAGRTVDLSAGRLRALLRQRRRRLRLLAARAFGRRQ